MLLRRRGTSFWVSAQQDRRRDLVSLRLGSGVYGDPGPGGGRNELGLIDPVGGLALGEALRSNRPFRE
jgi:hypothetical protein